MTLSIIIPVYNAESFIDRCLSSIFSQKDYTFSFEVITINDGSKDKSLPKLEKWAEKHHNLIVIDSSNKGAGSARNKGIKHCSGKFIWFIDIDDFIEEGAFSFIEKNAINKNQTIGFNYYNFTQDNKKEANILVGNDAPYKQYTGLQYTMGRKPFYLWCMIYKKEIIDNNNILFIENIKNIEDFEFNMKYFSTNPIVTFYNKRLYTYCYNNASTSRNKSRENLLKLADDSIVVINSLKKLTKQSSDKILNYWLYRITIGFYFSLATNNYYLKDYKLYVSKLKAVGISQIKTSYLPEKRFKLSGILFNIHPILFYYLIKLIKK